MGWGWKWTNNKWNKPPINARTGGPGKSNDPATWCTWDEALAGVAAGRCDGIGFALGDGFAGIDLDDCRCEGELSDVASDIIAVMDTYTEVSPTGTLPPKSRTKNKVGTVEVYSSGRYFTLTGESIGSPEVEERQEQLMADWQKFIGGESRKAKASHLSTPPH